VAATDALCRSFLDLWWHFDPSTATAGRLGDFSSDGIRQHVAALRSLAGAAEELEVEDTADEIDRTALLDHLRVLLFRFEHEHPYRTNPLLWTEHLIRAFTLPKNGSPDQELLAAAALERLRGLPGFCLGAVESIRRPPALLAEGAVVQVGVVSALIERVRIRFGSSWDREGGRGPAIVSEANAALEELRTALTEQIVPDSDPHAGAIGEAEVDRRLHYEHASIHNAGEVWRGALRTAADIEQEVIALAAAVDSNHPWREVCRSSAGAPVAPEEGSVVLERWLGQIRDFLRAREALPEHDFVPLEIQPLPEGLKPTNLWAQYQESETEASLALGALPEHLLPWVAIGLVEPGAHLHGSIAQNLPGMVRRHIAASSTTGGWVLYARELMTELGVQPDPHARLMERVLLLRDVHLALVDIGLHTKQLSVAEAIGHLAERIPFDPALAIADVRRMLSQPLLACASLLGRQELRRLRDDYQSARGDRFTLRGFHRELLQYGGLPIPLIRWGMGLDG
jgi:hypothetical protein